KGKESTRAFVTRYTDDTLQILGLHEEQRISGFVHGLRTRSLMEFLSTDLPTTYKGLMEKNYTWIEAREVTTNRFSKDGNDLLPPHMFGSRQSRDMTKYCHFHEYHGHNTNYCRELRHQIEEAVKSGQLSHLVKGIKKSKAKALETQQGDWKKGKEEPVSGLGEITFPHVLGVNNSSDQRAFLAHQRSSLRNYNRQYPFFKDGDSQVHHRKVQFSAQPTTRKNNNAENGYRREGPKRLKEASPKVTKGVLSCIDAEERIIVNEKYLEQTIIIGKQLPTNFKEKLRDLLRSNVDVFAWTHADMTGIPRTIMVRGKPFNIEHKLKEYKHIKLVKRKKRGLGPIHSKAPCKEVEELTKAGILQKIKDQTWVANPVMVKKSGGVTDLEPPRTLKDEQSLNEKLVALSLFLSKGAEKSLPFFKTLKNYTNKKTIQWTADTEESFQKIKKFMEILPTLTAPIKGEVSVMYLAASAESISVVLLTIRDEMEFILEHVHAT
nr:reverse transcriptase domain-containing protein [Tanacetum cinerariifolium]